MLPSVFDLEATFYKLLANKNSMTTLTRVTICIVGLILTRFEEVPNFDSFLKVGDRNLRLF